MFSRFWITSRSIRTRLWRRRSSPNATERVHRWYLQARTDSGQRREATIQKLAQIANLKATVRRLEEDNDILRRATVFFATELDLGDN